MNNTEPLYIALGTILSIGLFLFWHRMNVKAMRAAAAYRQHMLHRNVMAISHLLLKTLETQVKNVHKEVKFSRDDRFSISDDRGSAHAVLANFVTWYNIVVAPTADMSPIIEDIMITKVDRVDTDDGTWALIHLGQGNDVIKHFLPDRSLQSFITSVRAMSSYMQIGANLHQ